MIRPIAVCLALASMLPLGASAAEPEGKPLLALWEFDGWSQPTPERPLGLRFLLLDTGQAVFSFDDPALDPLIPATYFQAQLPAQELSAFADRISRMLAQQSGEPRLAPGEGDRTAFYFRDPGSGAVRLAEVAGHPCLARGRVFSATAPVAGLKAVRNSMDREALPSSLREVCDLLTGFHHAGARSWDPAQVPAPLPER